MKNQVFKGDSVNVAAPAGGVVSGNGYLIGNMFGVAAVTVAAGVNFAFWLVGCYNLTKNPAEAWTVGQLVYWDNVNFRCTATAANNTRIGVAIAAAANPSSSGWIRLNGAF
jgi:predicted RecA/RadA family phage recombinase